MHVAEVVGQAVTWQVDGDDAQVVHVGEHIGTPYVEVLHETVQQEKGLRVVAAFVAIVDGAAVDGEGTVLLHVETGVKTRCKITLIFTYTTSHLEKEIRK